jgi:hypothetical protein
MKTCKSCKYYREPGMVTLTIESNWCSNTKSPNILQAVSEDESCEYYERKGVVDRILSWILRKST